MSNILFDKYKHDTLTPDELHELRQEAEHLSDDDIEKEFLSTPEQSGVQPTDSEVRRMREIITGRMMQPRTPLRRYRTTVIAAAVMVPLLLAVSVYLYINFTRYRDMASEPITIMTGKGERVTTRLPDGTTVNLNYCSQLVYTPELFNSSTRSIKFEGEGYFDVHTDTAVPFIITANGITVKVLGTQFNLLARNNTETAALYLDSGSVELSSINQTEKMHSGQLAQIDCGSGRIQITDSPDDRSSAWRNGELLFHDKSISDVMSVLETNYNYTITLDAETAPGHFSGCLPANDLNRALRIMETLYDIKADVDAPARSIRFTH